MRLLLRALLLACSLGGAVNAQSLPSGYEWSDYPNSTPVDVRGVYPGQFLGDVFPILESYNGGKVYFKENDTFDGESHVWMAIGGVKGPRFDSSDDTLAVFASGSSSGNQVLGVKRKVRFGRDLASQPTTDDLLSALKEKYGTPSFVHNDGTRTFRVRWSYKEGQIVPAKDARDPCVWSGIGLGYEYVFHNYNRSMVQTLNIQPPEAYLAAAYRSGWKHHPCGVTIEAEFVAGASPDRASAMSVEIVDNRRIIGASNNARGALERMEEDRKKALAAAPKGAVPDL